MAEIDGKVYTHDYEGPINVGDVFVWEPTNPDAMATVRVIRVNLVEGDQGNTKIITERFPGGGEEHWNFEDRFREACVKVPMNEVPEEDR